MIEIAAPKHMTDIDQQELRVEMARLRQEHHDLDASIAALTETGRSEPLQVQRLKKRKLVIKDRVSQIEDELMPDIIA